MVGIGLLLLQQASGITSIMFYGAYIFKSVGVSSIKVATLGLGAIQVVMTAFTAWLMDKAGRRLLMISSGGMVIFLFLVGLAFFLENHVSGASQETTYSILALIGVLVYIVAFALGMGAIPWLIISEVIFPICQFKLDWFVEISGCEMLLNSLSTRNASYLMRLAANYLSPSLQILPVNVKDVGDSIATLINWLSSFAVAMTINLLLEWSTSGTFWIYALVSSFTVVFFALWVPKTKGQTLEEIQSSFQ